MSRCVAVLFAVWFGLGSMSASAAVTWDAGAGTDSWATGQNWDGPDAVPTATDDVIFPTPIPIGPAIPEIITVGPLSVANSLTFNDTYTLTGGDLTLTTGNIAVALGKAATIDSVLAGGALTKLDAGTLILGGTNTFNGATTVSAGALRITAAGAVADTTAITVANNARLELSGGINVNKAITISGNGGDFFGALRSQSGNNEWSGNVTLGSDGARLGAATGTSLTVSGVIDSGSNVYGLGLRGESNTDTITLSGANTYLGGTQVIVGIVKLAGGSDRLPVGTVLTIGNSADQGAATLDLNGFNQTVGGLVSSGATMSKKITSATAATLAVNSTADGTYSGAIEGALSLVKSGSATLTLSGSNTFTGGVTVNGGTLSLNNTTSTTNTYSGGFVINAGGTLRANAGGADSTAFNRQFGATGNSFTFNGGTFLGGYGSNDRTMTNRSFTITSGGSGTFNMNGTFSADFQESAGFTQLRLTRAAGLLFGDGATTLTKAGGGRLTLLSDSPGFAGTWSIDNGTVEANGTQLGDGSATNSITLNGGILSLTGTLTQPTVTLNGGALAVTGASRTANGSVTVTAPSYVFLNNFWNDNGPSLNLTLAGKLSGSQPLGVAVNRSSYDANSGALILQNTANDISGTITVGKNLAVESNSSTGSGYTLGTAPIELAGGTLRLRDDGTGDFGTITYGAKPNVTVIAPTGILARGDLAGTATVDVGRSGVTAATGNTIQINTLDIADGLTFKATGANAYQLAVAGQTTFAAGAATSQTIEVGSTILSFPGGVNANGKTIVKEGPGTLQLDNLSTWTNLNATPIQHNAGTLQWAQADVPAGDIDIPVNKGFGAGWSATQANLIDRITDTSAGVVALGVDATFNPDFTGFTGGIRLGASDFATLTGTITSADGTVRLGGGAGMLTLATANAVSGADNLDIGANGTAPGAVFLAADNSFSGAINIADGMLLKAASHASLGTNTAAPLTINNGTLALVSGGDFAAFGARSLSLGALGATLDTGNNSVGLAGLSGAGNLTKEGVGKLTLTTANSGFSGAVNLTSGTLSIQNAAALGTQTTAITVAAGTAFELAGDITFARAVNINGTGVGDTGALRNLSGNNTITGIVALQSAASIVSDAGTLTIDVSGTTTGDAMTGAFPLTVGGAGNVTIADRTSGLTSVTKVGAGELKFTGDPNHSGLLTVNEGVVNLALGSGSIDFNSVVNSGGVLINNRDGGIGDAYDITVNGAGILKMRQNDTFDLLLGDGIVNAEGATANRTITVNASSGNSAFAGTIENGGSFTLGVAKGSSANALVLTGANTYTGTTNVYGGTLRVEGNAGSIAGSGQVTLNRSDSVLVFGSNADTNAAVDRIKDTTEIELQDGSQVVFNGSNDLVNVTTETFGQLETNSGANVITLVPAAGAQLAVTSASLLRSSGGTLLVRGAGLGATGADSARLFFTTAPTGANFVGGAGAPGATTQSIIPYIVGDTAATGTGASFVTYDATSGVRPLQSTEYAAAIAGGVISTNNVSLAQNAAVTVNSTINALRLTTSGANTGGVSLNNRVALSVTSGAILDATAAGGSISGGALVFGTAPIVFDLAGESAATPITTAISSGLTGSGGLALSAANPGSVLALGGFNVVTGDIVVNKGVLQLNSANALNPFSRNNLRFSSEAGTSNAILRLNGFSTVEGSISGNGYGRIENGAATPATIGLTIGADLDSTNLVLQDGGAGALNVLKYGANRVGFQNDSNITGTVTVREGTFELKDGADWDSLGAVVVEGGSFKVYNTDGGNTNGDRLPAAMPVTLRGGAFYADTSTHTSTNYQERVGQLRVEAGVNAARTDWHTTATQRSILWFWDPAGTTAADSLLRNPGAVLKLEAVGATGGGLGSTAQGIIRIGADTADPAPSLLKNGILHKNGVAGWSVVGDNFVTLSGDLISGGNAYEYSLTALTAYQTSTDATAWAATDNVKLTSAVAVPLAVATTINSLILGDAVDLDLNGQTLTVDAGGVLAITSTASGPTKLISNGGLTAGDFAGNELVIRAGDYANTANAAAVNISANIVNASATNPTTLTKWGGKNLILSGANTFTGNLNLTEGALVADAGSRLGVATTGRTLNMAGATTLDMSTATAAETLPFDSINVTGIGQATVTGASTQTLTFNGAITGRGSLRLNNTVDGALTAVNLENGLTVGGSTTTPIASALPVSNLTLGGGDNVVGGSLQVGVNQRLAELTQTSGTLQVGFLQYLPELNIGYRTTDAAATTPATRGLLDLSGTTDFQAQVNYLRVGVAPGASSASTTEGDLLIGQNSALTVNTEFIVGDSPNAGNSGVTSSVMFGSGTNNVQVPFMVVGGRKSIGEVKIAAGGTLTLTGLAGSPMNLTIGDQRDSDTGTFATGTVDMTGGTLLASFNALEIGDKQRASGNGGVGGATGTLKLGAAANAVTANSVLIGRMQRSTGTAAVGTVGRGTLDFGGGTFDVYGDVTLGDWIAGTETKGAAVGALNITGGMFTVGGNIVKTDSDRSAAVVTVDGPAATLKLQNPVGDTTPGSMTLSQLVFRNGTIADVASTTLDGRGVTNGTTFAPLDDALIVRDVTLPGAVNLTNAAANKGGVRYEAAGGGAGGTLAGAVSLGAVNRTFAIEDSAAAINDLTVNGAVSGAGALTKTGLGTLLLAGGTSHEGDTNVNDGVLKVVGGVNSNLAGTNDTYVGTASTTATLITDHVRQDTLTINAGSKTQITGTNTSVVNFLQIANAGGGFTWDAGSGGAAPSGSGGGVTAVPEPATWLLAMIAAIAGLVAWLRRR